MTTKSGVTSNIITEFRNCKNQDFEQNGYDAEIAIGAENLLCPDVENLQEKYMLRNGYDQRNDRTAISFEVIECNPSFTEGCKDPAEISKLLEHIFVTQYFVIENINFGNYED